MNWRFTACAVIAAGLMNGCAVAPAVALSAAGSGAIIGGSESREDIKEQAIKSCSLFAHESDYSSCQEQANAAFNTCEERTAARIKHKCYRETYNNIRQQLIAECNQQTDKDACLKNVPNEK
jgi:hypothetical protein